MQYGLTPRVSWKHRHASAATVEQLQHHVGLPRALAHVLVARGLDTVQKAQHYLSPTLQQLPDPNAFAGMQQTVQRLVHALKRNETIGLFGDYDVDGVTSTTLLWEFIELLGGKVVAHVPDRLIEGYGMSRQGVQRLQQQGAKLIVSVDCGISDHGEIAYAAKQGLDVIVIDHHTVPPHMPQAHAVINPHRPDCKRAGQHLCAVAIAFNVCIHLRRVLRQQGFFRLRPEPNLSRFLDLVALGTVADVMPLVCDNRVLVHWGIQHIAQGRRVGVQALLQAAGLQDREISSGSLGFHLAPRINAAGRLDHAMGAVHLLKCQQWEKAWELAQRLDEHNRQRRQLEQKIVQQAVHTIETDPNTPNTPILVVGDESWHPGVVGIVASRLVDRFARPALVIGAGGKGSGRSIPAFHLHAALQHVGQHLEGFGGHAHAVGISLGKHKLDAFRQALTQHACQMLKPEELEKTLQYDAVLPLQEVTMDLAQALKQAAPFGRGNPQGVFRFNCLQAKQLRLLKDKHLKGAFQGEAGSQVPFIAFSLGHKQNLLHKEVDVLACVEVNQWQGRQTVQLQVLDMAPAGEHA
ncbi:MAG: single-stranded-DNA-specific exonuclease RecJ [Myxococcota bacterium]